MKSIWDGSLSVGALAFPMKLGPVVSDDRLELHRVRRSDGSRIEMRRFAKADGEPVEYADTIEGYETGDGRTVLVEKEDKVKAYGEKNRGARILMFVPEGTLPRTAHDSSYHVQPGKGGERVYALLAQAMLRSRKAAVVSFALREKEENGLLYATQDGHLVLERLNWAAEVKEPGFELPAAEFSSTDMKLADQLVAEYSGEFDWASFTDKGEERLQEIIRAKAETGQSVGTPVTPNSALPPANLTDVLQASVEAAKKARTPAAPVRKARTRKPAAKKEEVA